MEKNMDIETVKAFYNANPELEWERLSLHPFEFQITKHYLNRYVKPGSRILDIGGGPGRYSLYLAEMGCHVTLLDLSQENVSFALDKAKKHSLFLQGITGDARFAQTHIEGLYDVVLLMGPMYHLMEESDRMLALKSALACLKPGGHLFVSFISINGGIGFCMREAPELILDEAEDLYLRCYQNNKTFCGKGFTNVCMTTADDAQTFMKQYPLKQLHFLGQESITAPCENNILSQTQAVVDKWTELALAVCEREDLLSWSEHFLYIGQKELPEQVE